MRYMGSKNRIAKEILPIILKDRTEDQYYFEPFCGGCNMIDKINDDMCVASDINEYLIELFRKLQSGWIPPIEVSEEMYNQIKNNKQDYPKYLVGYVGFLLSFGAKWFGGYRRDKEGKRNYSKEAFNNITKQVKDISNITFMNLAYDNISYSENSIIYCDPPYESTTKYKDDFNHEKFWNWVREMTKAGHKVFVSEYNAPKDFICIWEKKVTCSLDSKAKDGEYKTNTEKLFIFSEDHE